ncbi:ZnF_C2H2 [Nesidiocoris tenuis]|uniref:ZnF_C2H2 n=1 Tax=Nesidiocoris tenuis TaxID=355587 RepID=A0ABN7BDS2_9HEMI|nr:ZnF_C2H2 [Nesidiocoris tenuis]
MESTSKDDPCPYCLVVHTGPCGGTTPPHVMRSGATLGSPSGVPGAPKKTKADTEATTTPTATELSFLCEVCSKMFSTRKKLAQHRSTHSCMKPFCCVTCSKSFTSKFKLVRHLLIHSDSPLYTCHICGRAFHRKDHLKTHLRTHGPQKTISCTVCSKTYSCAASYKRHRAFHAAQDGHLNCQLCRYTAQSKDDILQHLKSHSGSRTLKTQEDKKYKCPNCDRRFFTQKDVRRHSVVHTGRRDYLCQYCPQRFGRRDHLVRHIRKRHTPDDTTGVGDFPEMDEPLAVDHPSTSTALPRFTSVFKTEHDFQPPT